MTQISIERPPPSTAAIVIATAILTGLTGYFVGKASALGIFGGGGGGGGADAKGRESWPNSYDVDVHVDSSDEELMKNLKRGEEEDEEDDGEEGKQGELKAFVGNQEECKLVLAVRTDLGMGKGKMAAQCSHATLACYKYFLSYAPNSPVLRRWEQSGQAKIAVQVNNEDEMEILQARAVSLGLCAQIIHDAGRTQVASGSATVCGIGPGPKSVVDQVTGHLKLL